jgi:hypothetical protein
MDLVTLNGTKAHDRPYWRDFVGKHWTSMSFIFRKPGAASCFIRRMFGLVGVMRYGQNAFR